MMRTRIKIRRALAALAAAAPLALASSAEAAIQGLTGTSFAFTARDGYISTPEGNSVYMWGYANGAAPMQFPGPTLILAEDVPVTVALTNALAVPVSLVFPGQGAVAAVGGVPGLQTREALPGQTVTYTFTPANPGTYTYYSGTQTDLQTEMGLLGAIVVRGAALPANQAYSAPDTTFDREYLFLMGDMDPKIHKKAEQGNFHILDMSTRLAVYWMLNGRMAPDTMADNGVPWLPSQPYNCLPVGHPGERILLRMVGGGRDAHPYHTHGNHHGIIARNGRLQGTSAAAADLSTEAFTTSVKPGETVDAILVWTGAALGWDVYGPIATCTDLAPVDGFDDATGLVCHDAACTDLVDNRTGLPLPVPPAPAPGDGFDDFSWEYCADHGKPVPVILPAQQELTFGPWYSGSPFLGSAAPLPPGEGGLNPNAAFTFMWHSHNEKEIVNFDLFPGGMLTMFFVEHFSVDLAGY